MCVWTCPETNNTGALSGGEVTDCVCVCVCVCVWLGAVAVCDTVIVFLRSVETLTCDWLRRK